MKFDMHFKQKFTLCRAQYIYLILAGLSIFLGLFTYVRAQETSEAQMVPSAPSPEERLEARELKQTERSEIREERRVGLSNVLLDRFVNLAQNAYGRLEAAHDRFTNIAGRLDTRIEKLKALGVDTTGAEASLAEANSMLAEAKVALEDIKGTTVRSLTGGTPRESMRVLREKFTTALNSIKGAHQELRNTVAMLKEAVRSADFERGVSNAVKNESAATETEESE